MTYTRRPLQAFVLVLALALSVVVVPDAGASGAVYEAPRSINSKGQKDVTQELLKFFATVPDGSTITFPARARYNIEGTLYLYGRRNLTFEGNGAEFFAATDGAMATPPLDATATWLSKHWPRHRAHWVLDRSTGMVLRNMTIRGANPNAGMGLEAYVAALEAQHGVEVAGSSALIQNVRISDTYGDFIYVGKGSSRVVVRDNLMERSGRQGVAVTQATDVVILSNIIRDVRRSVFDLEPILNREVHRVRIINNHVGPARLTFVAALGKGPVDDITIQGNVLTGVAMTTQVRNGWTEGARRSKWAFINNVSDQPHGSDQAMMRFWRVDGVTVQGNIAPIVSTRAGKAVETWGSCGLLAVPNDWIPSFHPNKADQNEPLIPLTTDGYESTAACVGI